MSRKNKRSTSSSHDTVQSKKDLFDVKENLKKLRSGTGKEGYETISDPQSRNVNDQYYSTRHQDDISNYSTTSTADRFEKIHDKFSSDLSILKDVISSHKEVINEKLNSKVDKDELKYWVGGAVGLVILIAGLIYTLSYQDVLADTKSLKENKNETNRRLDKVELKMEYFEKNEKSNTLETPVPKNLKPQQRSRPKNPE